MALVWVVLWLPWSSAVYGFANLLNLCDLAVLLSLAGLWTGSALLLSSQAVSSLVVDGLWVVDVAWRLVLGRHLIGGTEYMWDARFPLGLRLLSLFHVALPVLLVWALRSVGYDRRALVLQSGVACAAMLAAHLAAPDLNINFAHRDPFLHRPLGPPPIHLALTLAGLIGLVYLPTHLLLARLLPAPKPRT